VVETLFVGEVFEEIEDVEFYAVGDTGGEIDVVCAVGWVLQGVDIGL
jgi:hypothetical protein